MFLLHCLNISPRAVPGMETSSSLRAHKSLNGLT